MKKRIMVVDDDGRYLELLEFMLTSEGFEAIPVQNPREVQKLAASTKPDVIVLDVAMPELDGIALGMSLRCERETAKIPVIFVTAMSGSTEMLEGLRIGAAHYLSKPFSPRELIKIIRKALASGTEQGIRS